MSKAQKLYGYHSNFTDKFELIKKVLTLNSVIKSINGRETRLRPALINILAFYCLYGYSEDTKKIILDTLDMNRKHLNQINSQLTKQGYLVKDTKRYNNRTLSPEMIELINYFFDENNKNKVLMVRFNER